MSESLKLVAFCGSLRKASFNRLSLQAFVERLPAGATCETVEIGDWPLYDADLQAKGFPDKVQAAQKAMLEADGIVLVSPEYNYGISGVLKNAIDWASRPAYQSAFRGKSCFVVSVSGGAMGGVRAQAHLKYILNAMLAQVFPFQEVIVPEAPKKVIDGRFTDDPTLSFGLHAIGQWIASLETPA